MDADLFTPQQPVMLEVKNRWQTDDGSYSPNK